MKSKKRLFVLALDGTPFSLLRQLTEEGLMPHFKELSAQSVFRPLNSVQPPLSSVAWASFMTGGKPNEHGISGFVERDPQTMDWFVPNAKHLKRATIFQTLSQKGKRVFSMNVPVTYPPFKVNGILISGFLCKDIRKGTFPPAVGAFLKARGYVIDADVEIAKRDLKAFFDTLLNVLEKRMETLRHFFQQEAWDLFMAHIMETDRLHHIFWKYFDRDLAPFAAAFRQFYRRIDELIGQIVKDLPEDMALLMLSDHGFTRLQREVYLNRWLLEKGYLFFEQMPPRSLHDLHPFSKAYSLYPGRIYINLKGREKSGSVQPGLEYENICQEIGQKLLNLKDEQGRAVIKEVRRGYELYGIPKTAGDERFVDPLRLGMVPDLLAIPQRGYDLKGVLWHESVFDQTVFSGTHTFDDAFVLGKNFDIPEEVLSIEQLHKLVLEFFAA